MFVKWESRDRKMVNVNSQFPACIADVACECTFCFGCVDDELGVVSSLTDAASINYNRSGRKPVPSISDAPIVINLCVMGNRNLCMYVSRLTLAHYLIIKKKKKNDAPDPPPCRNCRGEDCRLCVHVCNISSWKNECVSDFCDSGLCVELLVNVMWVKTADSEREKLWSPPEIVC